MSSDGPNNSQFEIENTESFFNHYQAVDQHLRTICAQVHDAIQCLTRDESASAIQESLKVLAANAMYARLRLYVIQPGSNPTGFEVKCSVTSDSLPDSHAIDSVQVLDCMLDSRLWIPEQKSASIHELGHVIGIPIQVETRLWGALLLERFSTDAMFLAGEIAMLTLYTDALGNKHGRNTHLLQLPILNPPFANFRYWPKDDSSGDRTSKIIQQMSSTIWACQSMDSLVTEVLSIIGRSFGGRLARLAINCQGDTLHCFWLASGQYIHHRTLMDSTAGAATDFSCVSLLGLHVESSANQVEASDLPKIAQLRGWQVKTRIKLGPASKDLGFLELYADAENSGIDPALANVLAVNLAVLIQSFDHPPADSSVLKSRKSFDTNLRILDPSLEQLVSSLARVSKQTSTAPWSSNSLSIWLAEIAQSLGASYAIIGGYLPRSSPVPYVRETWRSSPEQPVSISIPRTIDFEEWTRRLAKGESIWACRDELVDPVSRDFWLAINCGTGVQFPVVVRDVLWGWVFFEFVEQRPAEPVIISLLEALVAALANCIALNEAKYELERSQQLSMAAVADEKIRISRNIHDTVTQEFLAILLYARAAQKGESVEHHLQTIEETARVGVEDARRSIESLRSGIPLSLSETIELALPKLLASTSLNLDFESRGDFPATTHHLTMEVRYIVEEAVRNVVRHAHATELKVLVNSHSQSLLVAVTDNGVGFDNSVTPPRSYGILGMQERAQKIGGVLEIESVPGIGTRITLRLEYPDAQ